MKTRWMILTWSALLIGCDGNNDKSVVSMVVDNHQVLCSGEGQWLCPQVQLDGGDWEALACGVDGLDYQWGTTYTITAEKTGIPDLMVDGCGDVFYALVSVENETFDGADRAFSLDFVYDTLIVADSGGGSIGGAVFVCADDAVCETVASITPDWQETYNIALQNPSLQGDPLVLTAIND